MWARPISVRVLVLNDPPARQAWRNSDGVAQGVVTSGRISDQLVAADEDPCTSDNGGCHGLVACTADPSNAATGVLCGQCPDGYAGDAAVAGTGCLAGAYTRPLFVST